MKLVRIDGNNSKLIQEFLLNAGTSLETFRYFKTRDINSALNNHLITYVYISDNTPVAYGHLDKDGEIIWLGVAVNETSRGKGIGRKMIEALIDFAKGERLNSLSLSVDEGNEIAIRLYTSVGFSISSKKNGMLFFKLNI